MPFLLTHPNLLAAATENLAAVDSATTAIIAAAQQVPALSAAQFATHAWMSRTAQAAAIHQQFTTTEVADAAVAT